MIQVRNLTKYYGDLAAIQDVSFTVEKGEVLGFLGPNAAGKTTTMRILTGFLPPSSGTARVAGYDVLTDSLEVRRRIGYLPETVPLYPEMTVWSYLNFVARLRGVEKREKRVAEVMEICHVDDHANVLIGKLSKGYRQRVGLAQALVHDPEVLILDEPTLGLDPKQIIEVRELIRSLGGERTIILSTHILPEVSQTCQRVLIINEGRIVAEDTPERLTARLKGAERIYLEVANPSPQVEAELARIEGVTAVESKGDGSYEVECALGVDRRPEIAATAVRHGWGLLEMRPMGMSLEEIFLKLTTE
ncbi:MAG TPA: ATP-binding cassette domain-containing protein [Anaerolineae bacterium]|nr:ATP-binding cassette domain-containing protein [Anaerolineae bacterium]